MDLHAELYNTNGNTTNDSSSLIFLLIYLCFLGFWVFVCFKNKPYVHNIHVLMGALLVVVMLDLICGPADKQYVKLASNVDSHDKQDVLIYIVKSSRLVLFYTVIVLISAGWSLVKLQAKEKIASMIVILYNVAFEVIMESNHFHKDEATWNDVSMTVETICTYIPLIVIALICVCLTDETKHKVGFVMFRILAPVTLYGFYLRDAVYTMNKPMAGSDLHEELMSNAACNTAAEIFSLVFCMLMFYLFRPARKNILMFYMFRDAEKNEDCAIDLDKNEYFVVDVEDEEEVAQSGKGKKKSNGPKTEKNQRKRIKRIASQVCELESRLEMEVKEREEMEARLHEQMLELVKQFMQSGKPPSLYL